LLAPCPLCALAKRARSIEPLQTARLAERLTDCRSDCARSDGRSCGTFVASSLYSMNLMKLRNTFCFVTAIVLASMLACPAIASSLAKPATAATHCGEKMPTAPQQSEKSLCCCDQNAVPVQALHAPFASMTLFILDQTLEQLNFNPASESFPAAQPYSENYLAKLSALRL
jgi:hypothetical protein